ncbi:hypothetical protein GJR97_00250 [Agromyces sp. Q22]|uniref:NTP pyrophosphohydrolase n=2 Tax=Agromyces kandeliae TaxID=2666141 RepID=A0A6L5QWM3_9MICO|nr:hypothetical protein [Agromyces kandeliae]
MGSRPDGWWRDRAAAATRLLGRMPGLVGRTAGAPDGASGPTVTIGRVVAVLEGIAKAAAGPAGIEVVRAAADGDGAIVDEATRLVEAGERVLVVTADRGLRARLADDVAVVGPHWFNDLVGR